MNHHCASQPQGYTSNHTRHAVMEDPLQGRRQFLAAVLATTATALHPNRARSAAAPQPSPSAGDLVKPTRALLGSLRAAVLEPFLADWPDPEGGQRRPVVPAALPVLRWLVQAKADAPAFSRELVAQISGAAPAMSWKQTYTSAQVGEAFLRNYGWSEIVGTTGTVPSERIACGFLLLGPQTHYPLHQHEAEEIYVPLAGRAAWEKGDEGWREQRPGTVIHHPSNVPHAMRTGAHPLLALYLWRSDNLRQKARLLEG